MYAGATLVFLPVAIKENSQWGPSNVFVYTSRGYGYARRSFSYDAPGIIPFSLSLSLPFPLSLVLSFSLTRYPWYYFLCGRVKFISCLPPLSAKILLEFRHSWDDRFYNEVDAICCLKVSLAPAQFRYLPNTFAKSAVNETLISPDKHSKERQASRLRRKNWSFQHRAASSSLTQW